MRSPAPSSAAIRPPQPPTPPAAAAGPGGGTGEGGFAWGLRSAKALGLENKVLEYNLPLKVACGDLGVLVFLGGSKTQGDGKGGL